MVLLSDSAEYLIRFCNELYVIYSSRHAWSLLSDEVYPSFLLPVPMLRFKNRTGTAVHFLL